MCVVYFWLVTPVTGNESAHAQWQQTADFLGLAEAVSLGLNRVKMVDCAECGMFKNYFYD